MRWRTVGGESTPKTFELKNEARLILQKQGFQHFLKELLVVIFLQLHLSADLGELCTLRIFVLFNAVVSMHVEN